MYRVKIYGAGSIGNHLAFACRSMGWDVLICDVDSSALERTKKLIYPERYGRWDSQIELSLCSDLKRKDYDLVFIGTPPDTHMELAINVFRTETPKVLLIEKPACIPSLYQANELFQLAKQSETIVCVGYDHILGENTVEAEKILESGLVGDCLCINADIKEHWGGIFNAHPWLLGPQDTYLGFWERGGGACGEHSHGINMWQHFAHVMNLGKVVEISACMNMVTNDVVSYDSICNITVNTESGGYGHIIQDVVTQPIEKKVRIQGTDGFLSWHVNWDVQGDALIYRGKGQKQNTIVPLPKKRTDDFRREIEHIEQLMNGTVTDSPISFERSMDTMLVIAAAYRSHKEKRVMRIDYAKGYKPEAITPA